MVRLHINHPVAYQSQREAAVGSAPLRVNTEATEGQARSTCQPVIEMYDCCPNMPVNIWPW